MKENIRERECREKMGGGRLKGGGESIIICHFGEGKAMKMMTVIVATLIMARDQTS